MNLVSAFLLLLSSTVAAALPDSSSVSSSTADYDGNALVLKGHVVLDHGLGKMTADQASLERQEATKDFPFSLIHLQKDVLLSLAGNAELRCDSADLDFVALKGQLMAKDQNKVIYTDNFSKKGKSDAFFRLLSQEVELEISKKGYDGKKTDYEIDTILAKEGVSIDYAQGYTLFADHALFRKQLSPDKNLSKQEIQGFVTAYPKDSTSYCRLVHDKDVIDAQLVDLDLGQSKLVMHHPKGILLSFPAPQVEKGELHFQSDILVWDHPKNMLALKGAVEIEDSALGTLQSDGEIQLVHMHRYLKSILSTGKTLLDYRDPVLETHHRLITYGPLWIDREHLHATLESPVINGAVPDDQQIYYEEKELALYADKASLDYSLMDGKLTPVALALKGNVRLFVPEKEKPPMCGTADRVTYSPTTHTLILSANPGKKVLFSDQEQNLKVSAQEIHITQDPSTKQNIVKGVGNVKFAFTADEELFLKNKFSQL